MFCFSIYGVSYLYRYESGTQQTNTWTEDGNLGHINGIYSIKNER